MHKKDSHKNRFNCFIPSGMKKMLLVSVIFLPLGFAHHVFAQGFVPIAPIPGLTDNASTAGGLAVFFNNLYKYLIGLAAVLAVIQITWSGIEIAMNRDDVSKIMDDKGKIYNAIYGLVLVLSPVLVFSIINPNILNLSLNLPPIDLTAPPTAAGPMSGPPVTRTTSGTGSWIDLYRCTDTGDCTKAKNDCTNAGGFVGQDYCVDANNNIVSNGKLFFGSFRSGNGCDSGLVPAMKCTPPK